MADGRHIVNTLMAHATKEVIKLTCQKCGQNGKLDLPHSTTDAVIVAEFRDEGWSVQDDGKGAVCPECVDKMYQIPEMSDEEIQRRCSLIRPLVRHEDKLLTVVPHDPDKVAFNWAKAEAVLDKPLVEVGRCRTLHVYGYYGFFKPSMSEVVRFIPEDLVGVAEYFEVAEARIVNTNEDERMALDKGFHVSEAIFYKTA